MEENLPAYRGTPGHMFSRVLEIRNSLFVDIDRKNRFTRLSSILSLSLFEERNLEELSVNVALGPRVIYARASLLFLDVSFSLSLSFFFIPRLELAF